MNWESPYYWKIEEGNKEGPFCQQCYDKNGELMRLQGNGRGYWECKTCKNNFQDSTYKPPSISVAHRKNPFDGY